MRFCKPSRRSGNVRKSHIPAVESVEDRLLLSATSSPAMEMEAAPESQSVAEEEAADEAGRGSENGPRQQRNHLERGGHHHRLGRMGDEEPISDESTDEGVSQTADGTADSGDAAADDWSESDQTTDDSIDSTNASSEPAFEAEAEAEADEAITIDAIGDAVSSIDDVTVGMSATTGGSESDSASTDGAETSVSEMSVTTTETDLVLAWNDLFGELLAADQVTQNPGYASRSMAILNLSIYDAVQLAEGNFASTFYDYGSDIIDLASGVFPDVAAAQAAYTALSSLYPNQQATIDVFAASRFSQSVGSNGNEASLALGTEVGNRVVAERADDGADVFSVYEYTDEIGNFAPDPLNPSVPAWGPTWGEVDTFAISSSDDFLPETPPELGSQEYAASYHEVLELGAADSEVRTAEQTEIGVFWAYDREGLGTPIALFNDILQSVADQEGNTFEENVTLFAQASVALADAGVTAWDTKFTEEFWRPVTAIHEGDSDGNDLTVGDPEWVALGAPDGGDDEIGFTPQFPTYISGHATFGAALFGTLQDFYGTDEIAFDVTSTELELLLDDPDLQAAYGLDLDVATRSFTSFSEAMAENGRSRVYLGIHFDFDDFIGQEVGQAIAKSVAEKFASLTKYSDNSTTAYVDLADIGSQDATIRAIDGILEVVDNVTQTVVSSRSIAETESVTVVGHDGQADRIVIDGIIASDLPAGLIVQAGDGAHDTLVITVTSNTDAIVVNQGLVDINGFQIAFSQVERVIIRSTDAADMVETADGVKFDVEVQDRFGNVRLHNARKGPDQLSQRLTGTQNMQRSSQHVAHRSLDKANVESESGNHTLDRLFESDVFNWILSMRTDHRR